MEKWLDVPREDLVRTIKKQAFVIDYLYYALGPAADDVMDSAYKYADEEVDEDIA